MSVSGFTLPDHEPGELKVSVREAARMCGISRDKVYRLIRRHVLPAYVLPGNTKGWMVYASQVRACTDNVAVVA